MHLKPGTLLQRGKYRIVQALGQGGFGITYEAEQLNLGRKVAIKEFFMKDCCERAVGSSKMVVPTQSNVNLVEKFKSKFIREAKLIASFDNPHIVRVLDVFEENDTAYYVMEMLYGGSLAEIVKNEGPLSESVAEKYIRQVADALSFIHARKTVHLDVKPSNILLNDKDQAVLIDFGISKHYDEVGEQTSTTPIGYSPGYAPLEQNRVGDVSQFTPATDIYALGATLYFLITGQPPLDASIINEEGLSKPDGVSSRIWNIIKTVMSPRRKDRPQSISAFLSILDNEDESTVFSADSAPLQNMGNTLKHESVNHKRKDSMGKHRKTLLLVLLVLVLMALASLLVFLPRSPKPNTYYRIIRVESASGFSISNDLLESICQKKLIHFGVYKSSFDSQDIFTKNGNIIAPSGAPFFFELYKPGAILIDYNQKITVKSDAIGVLYDKKYFPLFKYKGTPNYYSAPSSDIVVKMDLRSRFGTITINIGDTMSLKLRVIESNNWDLDKDQKLDIKDLIGDYYPFDVAFRSVRGTIYYTNKVLEQRGEASGSKEPVNVIVAQRRSGELFCLGFRCEDTRLQDSWGRPTSWISSSGSVSTLTREAGFVSPVPVLSSQQTIICHPNDDGTIICGGGTDEIKLTFNPGEISSMTSPIFFPYGIHWDSQIVNED